jgi:hypothetical protein
MPDEISLREALRQRDMWKSHWEELNAHEGEWRRRYEALLSTVARLDEALKAEKRSRLANARADAAERKLKAIRRSMMRYFNLQAKKKAPADGSPGPSNREETPDRSDMRNDGVQAGLRQPQGAVISVR